MDNQKKPERLFRYFPEKASDFFSAKKLWLSAFKDYNDPFDALPAFNLMVDEVFKRELQIIKLTKMLPPTEKRRDGKEMNYLELPPDSVKCLYLGWQISKTDRDELINSLEHSEWKRVEKFVMRPDETKFAIQPIAWKQWIKRLDMQNYILKNSPITPFK